MSALKAVRSAISEDVKIHILGFAKADDVHNFVGKGLDSVDTTSPLLRAFKDARANYYEWNGSSFNYCVFVCPSLTSPPLKRSVQVVGSN